MPRPTAVAARRPAPRGWVEDRQVIQARRARRRRRAAVAFPGVEADVVVVAAGRDERGARAVALHHLEPEHAAIEGEGPLEVGDLEVDVADAHAGIDRRAERGLRNARLHVRVQHAANLGAAGRGGQRPIGGQSVPGFPRRRAAATSARVIRREQATSLAFRPCDKKAPWRSPHDRQSFLMNKEHLEVGTLRSSRPRRPRAAGAQGSPGRSARQRRGSGPARRPPAPARPSDRAPAPDPGRLSSDLGGASGGARRGDAHLASPRPTRRRPSTPISTW